MTSNHQAAGSNPAGGAAEGFLMGVPIPAQGGQVGVRAKTRLWSALYVG